MATPFSGNVPHYDIIASDERGGHLVIQVKAINKLNWQFDASKFVEITMAGDRQVLGSRVEEPYANLYCVFVALGDDNTKDRYFIFPWIELADTIVHHHTKYLAKHGGVRPRAPKSTHCSISISQLASFHDRWDLILNAISRNQIG